MQDQLGLQQLQLHAHRAQVFAQQKTLVGEGQLVAAVGAAVERRGFVRRGFFCGRREVACAEVGVLGCHEATLRLRCEGADVVML